MTRKFSITFKGNVSLKINDIINFEQNQIDEIKNIAACYEKDELQKGIKYGIPLIINENQKIDVLNEKRNLVNSKTSQELNDQKIIQFGYHSIQRILKRVGSIKENAIIILLDRVKATDTVEGAQFKGFPTLSYTLLKNGDPDEYKFAISFLLRKKSRFIKMVTIHLKTDEPEETEYRIGDINPEYHGKLMDFKRFIEEQSKKS